ncbi:MAG: GNAT family N-acetyltransferase [Phaeodactylibacter sp.]|nr:GNAT family N-acetyltransferase [Phaeodactylibacter sp.]
MNLTFRAAHRADIPAIVRLLAQDKLGQLREDCREPLPEAYYRAFEEIDKDPNQELVAVEDGAGALIGTLQLTFIPYLTYRGGVRAQVEAVRIREDQRGRGIGEQLFRWAIARARERGAHLLQLTTDKRRPEAVRFYEKLGFRASHEGMKLHFAGRSH